LSQHEPREKPGGKWVNHVGTPSRAMKRRYQIGGTFAAEICDILTGRFAGQRAVDKRKRQAPGWGEAPAVKTRRGVGSDGQPQERMKRATIPDYPRAIGKSVSASPVINANATRGLAKHGLWRSMSSRSTCRHRPCSATGTGAAKLPTGNGRGPTQRPQTPTGRLFFERLPFERWPPERWPPERSPPERSHLEGWRVQDA